MFQSTIMLSAALSAGTNTSHTLDIDGGIWLITGYLKIISDSRIRYIVSKGLNSDLQLIPISKMQGRNSFCSERFQQSMV